MFFVHTFLGTFRIHNSSLAKPVISCILNSSSCSPWDYGLLIAYFCGLPLFLNPPAPTQTITAPRQPYASVRLKKEPALVLPITCFPSYTYTSSLIKQTQVVLVSSSSPSWTTLSIPSLSWAVNISSSNRSDIHVSSILCRCSKQRTLFYFC
jgi:hypothetical protein